MKRLFTEFRSAFPDWREEIVELVAEGNTVAGRFKCSGTHRGEFLGEQSGRRGPDRRPPAGGPGARTALPASVGGVGSGARKLSR